MLPMVSGPASSQRPFVLSTGTVVCGVSAMVCLTLNRRSFGLAAFFFASAAPALALTVMPMFDWPLAIQTSPT
jgi:hypothetical protein